MTKRLEAIKQRAEALEWGFITNCEYSDHSIYTDEFHLDFNDNEQGHLAAERLLSLYEPGATIEVTGIPYEREDSPEMGLKLQANLADMKATLVRLKKPGTYKLVPWPQEEGDG